MNFVTFHLDEIGTLQLRKLFLFVCFVYSILITRLSDVAEGIVQQGGAAGEMD